jgi:hypothetical protein
LSIVVPAKAGPFNLGTVLERATINVDPHTSQVTISSNPLPQIIEGIPLQVKRIDVTIDREDFIFNPTNCGALAFTGTITGAQGAQAQVSSPFRAANCAALPFAPKLIASTEAKGSKRGGASLDVKLTYPKGVYANIRSVVVDLPKFLPSRLLTIQKACFETIFDTNPALCPAVSKIATATATTPVLSSPLTGPAYLVSHGNAAFPDLVVVLQGEGVTEELTGSLFIGPGGVTRSTFASVPDVPVSSFELKVPRGPNSALTLTKLPKKAEGKLCGVRLLMPTTITAQNGAQIKQDTRVTVTECPKRKKRNG